MSSPGSVIGRSLWTAARGTVFALALLVGAAIVADSLRPGASASRQVDDDGPQAATPRAPAPAAAADTHVVQLDQRGQSRGGIQAIAPAAAAYRDLVPAYGNVMALDRLTALYNAALTNAAQLQTAETKLSASRTANQRARNLLKIFPTAKAQVETTEAAYALDAAGVDAAKAQIDALRNTAIQDWGPAIGEAVAGRTALATDLVHRKTGLVQIALPPGVAPPPPRRAIFTAGTLPPAEGRLVSQATQTDPRMQGAAYFYAVPLTSGLLPGMSVVAYLPKGAEQPGLGIPSSAVVWQAGKPWMYLRLTPDTFERYAIGEAAAPTPDGGYVVPQTSLPRDKPLVVAGAQILLSQEMKAQIPTDEDDN